MRCNQFQDWDCLSVSKLVEAFHLLMTYYVNESSSAKAGQGAFAIHPDLKSLFCELLPENLPYNSVPPPSQIVEYLHLAGDRGKTTARTKSPLYSPSLHYMVDTHPLPFSLSSSVATTALPWLSNGDILTDDPDRSGHVPSPAPGDGKLPPLNSPQRKLSVIPEVPGGFSRPPSLAELGVAVTGNCSQETVATRNSPYFQPIPLPRGLHQHSIESSVVTEGHYDASFETEDMAASFDVEPQSYQNYQNYDAYLEEPTILSNGHYQMSHEEASMLGISQANVSSTCAPVSLSLSQPSQKGKLTSGLVPSPAVSAPDTAPAPSRQEGRRGESSLSNKAWSPLRCGRQ